MQSLPWRGNIRELKSIINMAVGQVKIPIISKSHIESLLSTPSTDQKIISTTATKGSPLDIAAANLFASGMPLEEGLRLLKQKYFLKALEEQSLNDVAKTNGYSRTTLYRTLKELGIDARKLG